MKAYLSNHFWILETLAGPVEKERERDGDGEGYEYREWKANCGLDCRTS